jgi:LmbE family N-acetylglucosaminyl deacetylase
MTMTDRGVVFIGAHPDDLAAVAGTLVLLRAEGYRLHDVCLTRGEKGCAREPGADVVAVRRREEEAACALLGAELTMFAEPDGALYAHREICERVAARLAEWKPAAVITHWPLEKPDHAAAFGIAHKALHLAGLYFTTDFYLADLFGQGDNFRPDLYVNTSAVIEPATAVARCYRNQWTDTAAERTVPQARALGRVAWCEYAEGFATALPLMGARWNRPGEAGRVLLGLGGVAKGD